MEEIGESREGVRHLEAGRKRAWTDSSSDSLLDDPLCDVLVE